MRLDRSTWRVTAIVGSVWIAWVVISCIVGLTGPSRLQGYRYYAFECPNGEHHWYANCTGSRMGRGEWSPWMDVQTGHLDKTWHMMMQLMETTPKGLQGPIRTFSEIQARSSSSSDQAWVVMSQSLEKRIEVTCTGYTIYCWEDLLFWQNDPRYDQYRLRVRLEHDALLAKYIDDVKFVALMAPDSYTRMALGFKHAYGLVSLGLTIFWFVYMLLYKRWPYSTWNWEQRYVTVLLVGLNLYNNPIYGVQLASRSPFFPFWNGLCETIYVGIVLALWLTYVARFRRAVKYENFVLARQAWASQPHDVPEEIAAEPAINSNELTSTRRTISAYHEPPQPPVEAESISDFDPILDCRSLLYYALAAVYVILTGALYLWSSLRDRMTPIISHKSSAGSYLLLTYLTIGYYTFFIMLMTVQLCYNVMGARRHKDVLWGRYMFFVLPTMLIGFALSLGMLTNYAGPNPTSILSLLCFSALLNGNVYFMLWAYWPADSTHGGFAPNDATESASIFTETAPSYASHL